MSEMSVASINERAAEEYFKRGLEVEKEGNHEKAIEFYERALNENPDHETACFNLAVMYDRRADDAKAIELYERICTSPPVHLNALLNLAVLYEDNNHYDEAHRCLDAVLKTNPNPKLAICCLISLRLVWPKFLQPSSSSSVREASSAIELMFKR